MVKHASFEACLTFEAAEHCCDLFTSQNSFVSTTFPGTKASAHFGKVMERMRRLRAEIAPVDAHATSKAVGVDVYMGKASFIGKNELKACWLFGGE